MADKKISQFTVLAEATIDAANDVLAIVDATGPETKKASVSAIVGAGALAGVGELNVDNITINGNAITSTDTNGNINLTPNGTGIVNDGKGNLRAIPQSGSAKTGSYTLAVGDVGQFIEVGSGGSITVPDATFATGDVVSIFNNTTGTVTLTMSITTAYIGGADVDEATIDLATRGVATILFISGTVCVVNGNVS